MKSIFISWCVALSFILISFDVVSSEIYESCLVSFDVKEKSFETGNSTISCALLERRRGDLFKAIQDMSHSGVEDGHSIAAKLRSIESELKKQESTSNWKSWSLSVSGNALATVGLTACLETAGAGCALAAIGKMLSFVGVVDSAVGDSEKKAASEKVRKELNSLALKMEGLSSSSNKARERLVYEANGLCETVKKECL